MPDVEPNLYPMVIREMNRHENDVTNHRIMWLLIGQGLIANGFVSAGKEKADVVLILAPLGILVTFSAFIILYKSYQARGYKNIFSAKLRAGRVKKVSRAADDNEDFRWKDLEISEGRWRERRGSNP